MLGPHFSVNVATRVGGPPPYKYATRPRQIAPCVLPVAMAHLLRRSYVVLLLAATAAWAHEDGDSDSPDADSASGAPDLHARPLILVKTWCLLLVFAATLAGGVSPYFLKWDEAFLTLGTQFAGGVFLGTALMHFLSDSNSTFEDLTHKDYPFAFMLASAGFVVVMLADCVIAMVVARVKGVTTTTTDALETAGAAGYGDHVGTLEEGKLSTTNGSSDAQEVVEANGSTDQSVASILRNASTLGDSILLIGALCFHSVFEGIAIGVAETEADAWKNLWTISLHKIFAAIAMGIALLRMMPNRPLLSCFAYAFAFAISSPIGVGIGIVIDAATQGPVADWIYAISMGLATGVFVYVSINHLLLKGYKSQKPIPLDTPVNRWLAVVLGIGVIAVVMIWDT